MMNVLKTVKIKRSFRQIRMEKFFKTSLILIALSILILVISFLLTLIIQSMPSIKALGFGFLFGKTWDPVANIYGTYPFLLGTLLTSFLALFISVPFSFAIAIFLGEYYPRGWFSEFLKNSIELIAAVPSVIYGFWGLFVLVPLVRSLEIKLGVTSYGIGIFTSSLILAIMIVPYAASLGREMIRMVPSSLKEAAYSLGATRYEVIRSVILPYTKSGLFAGILLSLGRALGETMAVTMVIGNTSIFLKRIFAPGNTMASIIANPFQEPYKLVYVSTLIALRLIISRQ